MNRGSRAEIATVAAAQTHFNEAPIHESGKLRTCAPSVARAKHFNEAPIHESGKFGIESSVVWRWDTSMRPRFMNRGSAQFGLELDMTNETSMRPRFMNRGSAKQLPSLRSAWAHFNEAPIHESGKCETADERGRVIGHTSMRPRFMNRGSFASDENQRSLVRTSMRPRFMNRGSLALEYRASDYRKRLQ